MISLENVRIFLKTVETNSFSAARRMSRLRAKSFIELAVEELRRHLALELALIEPMAAAPP